MGGATIRGAGIGRSRAGEAEAKSGSNCHSHPPARGLSRSPTLPRPGACPGHPPSPGPGPVPVTHPPPARGLSPSLPPPGSGPVPVTHPPPARGLNSCRFSSSLPRADMSRYPDDGNNPFEDPAVIEHSTDHQQQPDLGQLYNPFEGNRGPPPAYQAPSIMTTPLPRAQPPERPPALPASQTVKKQGPLEQRTYGTQKPATVLTADLLRQQEELERKAAELDRKERELENAAISSSATANNWPPLPSFCPVKPCFHHDIKTEIPHDVQKTVTVMYYLWMLSSGVLFFNLLGSLAWFTVHVEAGTHFGLSILWLLLFTPCSFVCWYRPMYKAFRSDSSFNFFTFFFIFFVQDILFVLESVGIPGWGFCGWISSLSAMKTNVGVAAVMLVVSVLFTASAVMGIVMLKRVHSLYRRTGASFQKAQEELAAGVMSNQAVRSAASNAASSAAQSAFQRN